MSPRLAPDAVRGMLKARDPFELIRWLAYSQPNPRKARCGGATDTRHRLDELYPRPRGPVDPPARRV